MINCAGVYDLTAQQYHADPCPAPSLSASIGKLLLTECPRIAWFNHPRLNSAYRPTMTERFDLGTAAHAMTLCDGRQFAIIEAEDWRTKAAKEAREKARAEGKVPLLTGQYEKTSAMVRAGTSQFCSLMGGNPFTRGMAEQTLIWQEDGLWFRARLDWLRDKRDIWLDYKTTATSVNPDDLTRLIYSLGYDFQAAFYCRGIRALGLDPEPEKRWRFYFQAEAPPYLVSPPMAPTPRAVALGQRKVERAIAIWRTCMKDDLWPAYPAHVCHYDPPDYHEAQFEERQARDAMIAAVGDNTILGGG